MKTYKDNEKILLKRKSFWALAFFVLVFAIVGTVRIHAAGNVKGWPWSGGTKLDGSLPGDGTNTNLGWISMNRSNCDPNLDGMSEDGANNNDYPNCPNGVVITKDDAYGVNIPDGDVKVSGYAWNEKLGWIDFNPQNRATVSCSAYWFYVLGWI